MQRVRGYSRVPAPPARRTPFIAGVIPDGRGFDYGSGSLSLRERAGERADANRHILRNTVILRYPEGPLVQCATSYGILATLSCEQLLPFFADSRRTCSQSTVVDVQSTVE